MDLGALLLEIHTDVTREADWGDVPDSIPALRDVKKEQLGIALRRVSGEEFVAGCAGTRASIQSVSKVFALALALSEVGDELWQRVGREPSGTAFNSLVQLEVESGVPRNPFINAGALVVTDVLASRLADVSGEVLRFARRVSGAADLKSDEAVAASERASSGRNAAMLHLLRSFGNLSHEPSGILDAYIESCAIAMSAVELARAFGFLADGGRKASGEELVTRRTAKRINALMMTSGVYDSAGDFAFRVGLAGKSGVGGCIAAVLPGEWSVAVWSPGLDAHGNSKAGMRALELLTSRTGLSLF